MSERRRRPENGKIPRIVKDAATGRRARPPATRRAGGPAHRTREVRPRMRRAPRDRRGAQRR
ncbi:hypothetical protein DBB31_27145 [Burkholderia multivorans]|nr:hypothetical protein DBB31_27145 [Burkholderia multivorans]